MVGATAQRASRPSVDEIERQRGLYGDRGMQRRGWAPRPEADAGYELSGHTGCRQRQRATVAGHDMAAADHPVDLHLQPLDRGIDEARGRAGIGFLAKHVPRLERVAQLEPHAAMRDRAVERKAELALGRKP